MSTQFEFRVPKKLVIHNYTNYETIYQLIESEFIGLEGVEEEDEMRSRESLDGPKV